MEPTSGNITTSEYQYAPLKHQHSIRLLQIFPPGDDDAIIRCTLEDFNLDDKPVVYQALSYTWSLPPHIAHCKNGWEDRHYCRNARQESDGRWIWIGVASDVARLKVTPNLYDGLLQFQRNSLKLHSRWDGLQNRLFRKRARIQQVSMRLWVDAICINQTDVTERNAQVSMMARIYSSASAVIAWLGSANLSAQATVAAIQTLACAYRSRKGKYALLRKRIDLYYDTKLLLSFRHADDFLRYFGITDFTRQQWNAVMKFYQLEWFGRVWICQEIALAGQIHVPWGCNLVAWKSIQDCFSFITRTEMERFYARACTGTGYASVELLSQISQAEYLEQLRKACERSLRSNGMRHWEASFGIVENCSKICYTERLGVEQVTQEIRSMGSWVFWKEDANH